MGIIRMDQGPRRSLRGFFLTASVADNVPGKAPSTGKPAASSLKGLQRPREELALPERCGVCTHKLLLIRSHASYALTLFSIPLHRTVSPAIAHAGDRGSASSRIALPRPSRVDDLPMSAHSKYGAKQRVRQHVFWSFFDSRKSPVKA